jgi:hypothetical protein
MRYHKKPWQASGSGSGKGSVAAERDLIFLCCFFFFFFFLFSLCFSQTSDPFLLCLPLPFPWVVLFFSSFFSLHFFPVPVPAITVSSPLPSARIGETSRRKCGASTHQRQLLRQYGFRCRVRGEGEREGWAWEIRHKKGWGDMTEEGGHHQIFFYARLLFSSRYSIQ